MEAISVAVKRGGVIESVHRVHAVKLTDGRVLEARGDPNLVTFMRSAAKPLQARPLAGLDLPKEELAIACASHEALPDQLEAVRALLARAGAREEDLECGSVGGSKLRHNCSGKHAGMLLLARARGWPREGYYSPEHPLQQELLTIVAEAAGMRTDSIATATDGCGVVTFALSLRAMARAFASVLEAERISDAMRTHPELVGGPAAIDTRLMRALPGAIAKRGAEGVLCAALPDGTAVALKVEDGARRALPAAASLFLDVAGLADTSSGRRGDIAGRVSVL